MASIREAENPVGRNDTLAKFSASVHAGSLVQWKIGYETTNLEIRRWNRII